MDKIKLICVVGATASGKTALGVSVAEAVGGEVISADSMQVYKGMPIATAAATAEEQRGIRHHLLECLPPDDAFSVADFVSMARNIIGDIVSRGRVPIIVGGTGLFIDSLVRNIAFSDVSGDDSLRRELDNLSGEELYNRLKLADRTAADAIHPNNRKRIIRALELCHAGTSKTEQNEKSLRNPTPYDALYIGIGYRDRNVLYERINKRVDLMIQNGLVQEAQRMRSTASFTARQAIGHKELYPYLDGDIMLADAVDNLKKETRHYAKRQLTWFRRNEGISWLYADEMSPEQLTASAIKLSLEHISRRKGVQYEECAQE